MTNKYQKSNLSNSIPIVGENEGRNLRTVNMIDKDQHENAITYRCLNVFRRHNQKSLDDGAIECTRCGKTKYILDSGATLWAFPEDVELVEEQQDTPPIESELAPAEPYIKDTPLTTPPAHENI